MIPYKVGAGRMMKTNETIQNMKKKKDIVGFVGIFMVYCFYSGHGGHFR